MTWRPTVAVLLLTTAACTAQAPAGNPRVSFAVRGASLEEAASALSRAARIPLRVVPQPAGAEVEPAHGGTADFSWRGETFARALRELCRRFGRVAIPAPHGYLITFHRSWIPADTIKIGPASRAGVSVSVVDVRRTTARWRRPGGPAERLPGLLVRLCCEVDDGTAGAIAGIGGLVARDDLGRLAGATEDQQVAAPTFPDQKTFVRTLAGVPATATRLRWLEGDLLVHRVQRQVHVEIPVPADGSPARATASGIEVEYLGTEPDPGDPTVKIGPSLRVKTRVFMPRSLGLEIREATDTPLVLNAAGALLREAHGSTSYQRSEAGMTYVHSRCVTPQDAVPAKIAFRLRLQSPAEPLFTFRLPDVPLPVAEARNAGGNRVPDGVVSDHPHYSPDGGALVVPLVSRARPAGPGTLTVSLSRGGPGGWLPFRAVELHVPAGMPARLADLRSGQYRIRREFRPAGRVDRWSAPEVRAEVRSGAETALPVMTRD